MQTATAINQVFVDNMRQLWLRNPKLAQKIEDLPFSASLRVEPSKKGVPTASFETPDGRRLFLHSRYDPQREAAEFCDGLEADEAACVILCGLGLGYHLKAIQASLGEETVVLISEPDLVTIKTALETTDLSSEIAGGQVEILASMDKASLHERIDRFSTALMMGTRFVVPPASRDLNSSFHAQCRQAITDFVAFARMSLTTLVRNSGLTCRNIANNLPTYVITPPADILRQKFKGYPAILVAAGPSLTRNVDQLKDLQGKAVIIAAQTTLRPLLSRGIRPHFVTSLDFSDMSRQFFEGVDIPDEVVLVAEPKASWHVIDTWRGVNSKTPRRIILLDNPFAHRCVGEALARRTPMQAGATVMHLAFYLAQWLGCDPVIFIGQDLGFGGHCYYAPGMAMHRAWGPELGRFCTLEMKEWERIVRFRNSLRQVEDIHGNKIYTDEQMFTYLEQFERDFAKSATRVIDATEGGAGKRGAQIMPLKDAAAAYCRETINQERFNYLDAPWVAYAKLEPARAMLEARRDELEDFRKLCGETLDLLDELSGLVDQPQKFDRRIVRIDELRTLVQQHEILFQMVRDVSQLAELQRFAADRKLAVGELTGQRKARRQLARDKHFVQALLEGCDQLESIFHDSLERFAQMRRESELGAGSSGENR